MRQWMHIKIIIGNENNFHGSCAMKWHKSEDSPCPAPCNFNLSSRCGSNTNTNTCQLRVCVLYMCPFDLIEVFQHNYRALRAKSTATNQRCWMGGGGAVRQSKPLKLIMRLSVARTHTHSHSCGHLTLRHFVAFAYAWGPCGVYATSGTCNNYQAAAATATAAALVL